MKKLSHVLGWITVALIMFFPINLLIEVCLGLIVAPFSYSAFAVITGSVCITKNLYDMIFSDGTDGKLLDVLFVISAPLSILNLVFYAGQGVSVIAVVSMIVSCGCACILAVKHGKLIVLKIISLILTAVLIVPACVSVVALMIFGDFAVDTVVETIPSPNGVYYAEVVDSDQGALGGDTVVNVKSNEKEIDLLVIKISKAPQQVYFGEWREYENMNIYWKDKDTLIINWVEYDIR